MTSSPLTPTALHPSPDRSRPSRPRRPQSATRPQFAPQVFYNPQQITFFFLPFPIGIRTNWPLTRKLRLLPDSLTFQNEPLPPVGRNPTARGPATPLSSLWLIYLIPREYRYNSIYLILLMNN